MTDSERIATLQQRLDQAVGLIEVVLAEVARAKENNVVWPSTIRMLEDVVQLARTGTPGYTPGQYELFRFVHGEWATHTGQFTSEPQVQNIARTSYDGLRDEVIVTVKESK